MHSDNHKNQPYFEDPERLKEMLDKLPKNPKKTAEMGWEDIEKGTLLSGPTGSFIRISGIKSIALAYKAVFEPGNTPHGLMDELRGKENSKQGSSTNHRDPKTPYDIQLELEALAKKVLQCRAELKGISPEALYSLAQNEAVRHQPYWQTWFGIPEHWMGKEKDWDSHETQVHGLEQLARELKHQAVMVGLHKY